MMADSYLDVRAVVFLQDSLTFSLLFRYWTRYNKIKIKGTRFSIREGGKQPCLWSSLLAELRHTRHNVNSERWSEKTINRGCIHN